MLIYFLLVWKMRQINQLKLPQVHKFERNLNYFLYFFLFLYYCKDSIVVQELGKNVIKIAQDIRLAGNAVGELHEQFLNDTRPIGNGKDNIGIVFQFFVMSYWKFLTYVICFSFRSTECYHFF